MNVDDFSEHIEELRSRVAELQNRTDFSPLSQHEQLMAAFEELHTALEELAEAEAELWQQNEKLWQQNQDISVARAAIDRERQCYQELFGLALDGYLVTNENGTIREANRAAATLLKVSQRFLVGKPLDIFFTESGRRSFISKLNQLREIDQVQEWEVCIKPRQGVPIDATLSVAVVRNREGEPVALRWLLRDISSSKQVEEALLRAEVAEAQKVELEQEISSRQQVESQLLHNAFHDALTNLPNRALFMNRLERALEYSLRHEDYLFAVLFLDLDRFKVINDSLGHTFGDQLLIAIAGRLAVCLRPSDTVARLGGDEFTILLEGIKDISEAIRVAERIQAQLRLPFNLGEQEVFTTVSIGIALSATGYDRPEDLLRDADIAMYRAKSQGAAHYEIFNTDMLAWAVARLQLETELRQAVERQEFRILYQPIVALNTGCITGFEALVRWHHPMRGLVPPANFFSLAQETGLSIPIDRWVLAQACRQTQQWQEQFPHHPPLTISVNLCSPEFAHPDLIKHIDQILQETNLDPESLNLEIAESVIMENSESATLRLSQLRDLKIQLSIDNFGTGYSSLSHLHRFSISRLKIDGSFVSGMGLKEGNLEIVETIVTLAQKLGVDVTAAGVETKEQLAQIRELKCECGQGYFFSPPLETEAAEALIMAEPQW